jgi:hypothetical protein
MLDRCESIRSVPTCVVVISSGRLGIVGALCLGGRDLATAERTCFEDTLKAKLRLVVGLLRARLELRLDYCKIILFDVTHLHLIWGRFNC